MSNGKKRYSWRTIFSMLCFLSLPTTFNLSVTAGICCSYLACGTSCWIVKFDPLTTTFLEGQLSRRSNLFHLKKFIVYFETKTTSMSSRHNANVPRVSGDGRRTLLWKCKLTTFHWTLELTTWPTETMIVFEACSGAPALVWGLTCWQKI